MVGSVGLVGRGRDMWLGCEDSGGIDGSLRRVGCIELWVVFMASLIFWYASYIQGYWFAHINCYQSLNSIPRYVASFEYEVQKSL